MTATTITTVPLTVAEEYDLAREEYREWRESDPLAVWKGLAWAVLLESAAAGLGIAVARAIMLYWRIF